MTFAIFIISFYVALYITYPVIITFHELGHAFAYLILTKPDNIDIFIGSYGNRNTRLNFKAGKLHFFIKPSYFFSRGGQCVSSKPETNYIKGTIILLAGPLFSIIAAVIIGFIVFNTEMHGVIKLYCFALIICSFISLVDNLYPKINQSTNRGNDGYQLRDAFKMRKVYTDYITGLYDVINDNNDSAKLKLLKVYGVVPNHIIVVRLLANIYAAQQDYTQAEFFLSKLKLLDKLTIDELINLAYAQSVVDKANESISNYRAVLQLNADHVIALNNLGYGLILKEKFTEAEKVLTRAIKSDPCFVFAYNNLGLTKVLTGDLIAGKLLLDKGVELDPANSYGYKHLGIYYLKMGDKENASLNFNKARELDNRIDLEHYPNELE